jgi:hypothetical protein
MMETMSNISGDIKTCDIVPVAAGLSGTTDVFNSSEIETFVGIVSLESSMICE